MGVDMVVELVFVACAVEETAVPLAVMVTVLLARVTVRVSVEVWVTVVVPEVESWARAARGSSRAAEKRRVKCMVGIVVAMNERVNPRWVVFFVWAFQKLVVVLSSSGEIDRMYLMYMLIRFARKRMNQKHKQSTVGLGGKPTLLWCFN